MNSMPGITSAIEQATSLLEQADALIVAAGAGLGVDSGLPDFRGREGFWRAYPAFASRASTSTASPRRQRLTRHPSVPGASTAIAWPCTARRCRTPASNC